MAYYAFVNAKNEVVEVIVGRDENDTNEGVNDWEAYYSSQRDNLTAIRTSYNTRGGLHYDPETGDVSENQSKAFRFNYAGVGFTYDANRDGFIPPKPEGLDSWVLDEATCLWVAPIEYPADGGEYTWDESLGDWVEVVSETT